MVLHVHVHVHVWASEFGNLVEDEFYKQTKNPHELVHVIAAC